MAQAGRAALVKSQKKTRRYEEAEGAERPGWLRYREKTKERLSDASPPTSARLVAVGIQP